jgi:O-antigen/teichoic acid export membrane protein
MTGLSRQAVAKGAVYIYFENIVATISGYLLWLFLSKVTTPEVIGTASVVVSLAAIFVSIVSIGITGSVPRFLGKSFSEQKLEDARVLVKSSLLLVLIGIFAGSIMILFAKDYWILDTLDFSLIVLSILLMGSTAIANLFRYIVIASLKTKILVIQQIISSTTKIILAIILVLIGTGAVGLTSSFVFSQIITIILIAFTVMTIFKASKNNKSEITFNHSCENILVAGIPTWIPALIATIGVQLGPVIVFGSGGARQAGAYFMAFSIFTAITAIMYSLFSIAYPALSAMRDGRKRYTWRLIKMSIVISSPLSSSLIFYSKDILGLLGPVYVNGSTSMEILLISILPTAVMTGINTLVYSYGNYRQVLIIGISANIPRTVLYFILVPIYGGAGAAISNTIGSLIGFAVSIAIAKKIGMQIFWKDLIFILIIPTVFGYVLSYLGINYIAGILMTLIVSYVVFLKLQILTICDIKDSLGILPVKISKPIINVLNIVNKKLTRSSS